MKIIEDKITDIINLATKTTLNVRINEFKGKTPNITNLVTKTALNAVENKIPIVSNLVKKLTITQKTNEIEKKTTYHNHDKHITIPKFKKLTSENFAANLSSKNDVINFVKKTSFEEKL